jgi:signal transduction histidine kinase/DNA-binding response OmpR family regulator/ligand-binding sensor domain-containing protein
LLSAGAFCCIRFFLLRVGGVESAQVTGGTSGLVSKILLKMSAATRYVIAVMLLAVVHQYTSAQSEFRFRRLGTKDGLANDFVMSVSQDSLGYMWFQSPTALTRYDGYDFKLYSNDPADSLRSLPSMQLHQAVADQSGNIWLRENNSVSLSPMMLIRHDRKTNSFVKFKTTLQNNSIGAILPDKTGSYLWLGAGNGNGLYSFEVKTGRITSYLNQCPDTVICTIPGPARRRNRIDGIADLGSQLLVDTWDGLWIFDKSSKQFSRPPYRAEDSIFFYRLPPKLKIIAESRTDQRDFWIGVQDDGPDGRWSLVNVSEHFTILKTVQCPAEFKQIWTSARDHDGVVWTGTLNNGVFRYDPHNDSFHHLLKIPGDPESLTSNTVWDLEVDRDNNLWVATNDGVNKLPRKTVTFLNYERNRRPRGNILYKAKDGEYVIFGEEGEPGYETMTMAKLVPGQMNNLQFEQILTPIRANVIDCFVQGKHRFWISAMDNGVLGFQINEQTKMIEAGPPLEFRIDPRNTSNTIGTKNIAMWEDHQGNLWLAAPDGLRRVDPNTVYGEKGSVVLYAHSDADPNSIRSGRVWGIYPENNSSLWVITMNGVDLLHTDSQKFEHVFDKDGDKVLYRASDGTLFMGTPDGLFEASAVGGKYRLDDIHLWSKTGVTAIVEDKEGRLWLYAVANVGILPGPVCYDRKEKIALPFNELDGALHVGSIVPDCLHRTSDGSMIMLDQGGLTAFDPSELRIYRTNARPVLTKLAVNNKPPVIGETVREKDDFLMTSDISMLKELTIDYQHNNFSIEFSAMEMISPEKNLYSHKLEGYDPEWVETDWKNRTATYTNLVPGHYVFNVKASNHHGFWSEGKSLAVVVLPPPWRTWWAYASYGLIAVGLLLVARRTIIQRERLKSSLRVAQIEHEQEHFELEKAKEVDKLKSAFFTNISHEFRTPLTLIKGPVAEMLEVHGEHPKTRENLKLVQRNSDILLRLINQLLDLAKLESGSLTVEKVEIDLNSFLKAMASSFSPLVTQKNIELETDLPSERRLVVLDKDKLETIVINLLNNAVKFTPAGGRVSLKAAVNNNQLVLIIADNGIGIAENQHSKIFERFHQVSEAHKEVGTGIGLALVKELVALLGGRIDLKSKPGEGSAFTITLLVEVRGATEATEVEPETDRKSLVAERQQEKDDPDAETKPGVLVVEDNDDLRRFIIDCLGNDFHFLEASDGKMGLEKAINEVPDFIISDVMMPEMDGITMTGKIRSDIRTSHIPLILLTAKTSDESKLSGLMSGADDYLTKPFNKNELLIKVRNSIAVGAKMREKIRVELMTTVPRIEVKSADEQLLYKVKDEILRRLGDEQLSVESLAEEIGMSRVHLYRKVSALTGMSVNELIRKLRLQRAAQLLGQNWGPVGQVGYEVGFSNLSYFSKVFKEEFGVLPSEYRSEELQR